MGNVTTKKRPKRATKPSVAANNGRDGAARELQTREGQDGTAFAPVQSGLWPVLLSKPRWVEWRLVGDKKIPYQPGTNIAAKVDDASTWKQYDACRGDLRGLVFIGDGLGGIDLDGCRNPTTAEIAPWARDIIRDFNSYTEVSPSGTGVKIFVAGAPASLAEHVQAMPGEPINGKKPQIEAYVSNRYFAVTWQKLDDCHAEIRERPEAWRRLEARLKAAARSKTKPTGNGTTEIPRSSKAREGRNGALYSLGCSLRERGESEEVIRAAVAAANAKADPEMHPNFAQGPLPNRDVQTIIKSVLKKAPGKRGPGKESAANVLIELLDDVELWHDDRNTGIATVTMNQHQEHLPVRGNDFKLWLSRSFFEARRKAPQREALNQALDIAEGRARFGGPRHKTWLRVARQEERIYLDLGDESWRAVEISADGWKIVSDPPVRFRRTNTTMALPEPIGGGKVAEFSEFLNLAEAEDVKLVLCTLISYLVPDIPYPMLYLIGEMGSAKTSAAALTVDLIDPQVVKTPGPALSEGDMAVTAQQRWLYVSDNVSHISTEMSDAHCRLATGGGLQKRKLFSDEDLHALSTRRPQVFTGIRLGTDRPDFLDRVILIELRPIDDELRADEQTLQAVLSEARPRLLGLLLDGLAGAMKRLVASRERLRGQLPRMADFTIWAEAAAPSFGWAEGEFLLAYKEMIANRMQDAAEADSLVKLIAEWLPQERGGVFEGGVADLHDKLKTYLVSERRAAALEQKWWPKTSTWLGRELPGRRKLLDQQGITYSIPKQRCHRLVARALQQAAEDQYQQSMALEAATNG